MKNFDLESMGVHEMNALEMKETDGGFPLILAAIALIALVGATSCTNGPMVIQIGGQNNTVNTEGGGLVKADSTKIEIPLAVPIGY